MSDEPVYVLLARQAVAKAQEAYEAADEGDVNPFARAVVTQTLAEGDLILLSSARRVVRGE